MGHIHIEASQAHIGVSAICLIPLVESPQILLVGVALGPAPRVEIGSYEGHGVLGGCIRHLELALGPSLGQLVLLSGSSQELIPTAVESSGWTTIAHERSTRICSANVQLPTGVVVLG